jgi:hypothetical protein
MTKEFSARNTVRRLIPKRAAKRSTDGSQRPLCRLKCSMSAASTRRRVAIKSSHKDKALNAIRLGERAFFTCCGVPVIRPERLSTLSDHQKIRGTIIGPLISYPMISAAGPLCPIWPPSRQELRPRLDQKRLSRVSIPIALKHPQGRQPLAEV